MESERGGSTVPANVETQIQGFLLDLPMDPGLASKILLYLI